MIQRVMALIQLLVGMRKISSTCVQRFRVVKAFLRKHHMSISTALLTMVLDTSSQPFLKDLRHRRIVQRFRR